MLIITRGLPASGKSTQALEWIGQEPLKRARVNRDEMRQALYGQYHGLEFKQEQAVTEAQRAAVKSLLEGGKSVVVDDTNLRLKYARAWADLAHEMGVPFHVIEVETDVDQCVAWDRERGEKGGRTVGEEVIRKMASQFGGQRPPVAPTGSVGGRKARGKEHLPAPWSPTDGLPWVWLFDIDGTLAHNGGHRGWYDYSRVGDDTAWPEVVAVAQALLADGHELVFLSGRSNSCREQTTEWLHRELGHRPDDDHLLMRATGDHRKDSLVKDEIFEASVRGRWNVQAVFDDRPQVTRMWRLKGLRVLQCGDPYVEF